MKTLRAVEFYSGIGGLHLALCDAVSPNFLVDVVSAYEINPSANAVYRHNFPAVHLQQRNILSITSKELDEFEADIFVLSPPCQPFTRQGKQMDIEDHRTDSFVYLLAEFVLMKNPPNFIFVENVKGFETSKVRTMLLATLAKIGYFFREYLLSPTQFGVPNSRLRYYLLAGLSLKRPDTTFDAPDQIYTTFPSCSTSDYVVPLSDYLDKSEFDDSAYLLNDSTLAKYGEILDIVTADDRRSCCFTKGYGHFVEGTGSVIQIAIGVSRDECYARYRTTTDNQEKALSLKPLRIRYFTPREIANIMGFPASFCKVLYYFSVWK